MNYLQIISHLYPEADFDLTSGNVVVETKPKIGLREVTRPKIENNLPVLDENGQLIMETVEIEGPTDEFEIVITKWGLTDPKPTIAELDSYAKTQAYKDYLASKAAKDQETLTAQERAKNLLQRIKQERQWLSSNWDNLDTNAKVRNALSRVMKENEEILEALLYIIRRL